HQLRRLRQPGLSHQRTRAYGEAESMSKLNPDKVWFPPQISTFREASNRKIYFLAKLQGTKQSGNEISQPALHSCQPTRLASLL
ncbi:hypothetical protein, partial [Enterobacter bugandensis]|uniref:hypothetical protein n=1 Tax=Enterobacter bugandensis TaxID=881260 RepID=UPI0024489E7A